MPTIAFTTAEGVVSVSVNEETLFLNFVPDDPQGAVADLTIPRFKFEWILEALREAPARTQADAPTP